MNAPTEWAWRPQAGPQKALIDCPLPEIFFGGARGGGKTDGVLGKYALKARRYGDAFNALFIRREMPMLDDAIERSKSIYGAMGATWHEQAKTWRFPNGGRLRFRPLERLSDADKYQGQNISDICVEEAGQYPDPKPLDRLHGVLRSASDIPTQLIMTGNPGGSGQGWIKKRYIDPAPKGFKVLSRAIRLPEWSGGGTIERKAVFIPSRVSDNRFLGADYIAGLHFVGSEALVKAWLDGDWNAVEGAFFDCWSTEKHVISPISIPNHWLRFRSMDWGSASPFSIGWWAVASEDVQFPGGIAGLDGWGDRSAAPRRIPRGALIRYREWYGEGNKLTAEEVAEGILKREAPGEKELIRYGVLDPSAFAADGGPSIAERMRRAGVLFRPADNKRVARLGAMGGWDQMRARLKGDIDGHPMIVCFETCQDSIRTIPILQHDPDRSEDLDTDAEDHAADDWRYACMSRPWTAQTPQGQKPMKGMESVTLDRLFEDHEARLRR